MQSLVNLNNQLRLDVANFGFDDATKILVIEGEQKKIKINEEDT